MNCTKHISPGDSFWVGKRKGIARIPVTGVPCTMSMAKLLLEADLDGCYYTNAAMDYILHPTPQEIINTSAKLPYGKYKGQTIGDLRGLAWSSGSSHEVELAKHLASLNREFGMPFTYVVMVWIARMVSPSDVSACIAEMRRNARKFCKQMTVEEILSMEV